MVLYKQVKVTFLQERPPPVPPSRPYTVRGNAKIAYPQARVMKKTFPGTLCRHFDNELKGQYHVVDIILSHRKKIMFCVSPDGFTFFE
jgi:hypothetical protein